MVIYVSGMLPNRNAELEKLSFEYLIRDLMSFRRIYSVAVEWRQFNHNLALADSTFKPAYIGNLRDKRGQWNWTSGHSVLDDGIDLRPTSCSVILSLSLSLSLFLPFPAAISR